MKYRELGRTGWNISTISFGSWTTMQQISDIYERFIREKVHQYW